MSISENERYWQHRAQRAEALLRRARPILAGQQRVSWQLVDDMDAALATPPPPPEGEPQEVGHSPTREYDTDDMGAVYSDPRNPVNAPHTPEKAESYPLDSEGRCLKCGGTGRIGVDSTREPCPACTSTASQQAHGDALAELEFLETCAAQGTDGSMREAAINSVSVIRRHLTASGVPYVPEEVRQIPYEMRMNARQTEGGLVAQRLLELWSDKLESALASAPAVPELSHKTAMQLVEVFDNYEDERGPGTLGRRAESMQAAWRFVHRAAAPTDGRGHD